MSNLRRYYSPGQIYFITIVTYRRLPILVKYIDLLKSAVQRKLVDRGARILAWTIMPEHYHVIIDPCDNNLSTLVRSFKLSFSENLRIRYPQIRGRVWQYRFWDHIIRNEVDLNRHIDYIHFNSVKHGLVLKPHEWPYSSFSDFYGNGYYTEDWGAKYVPEIDGDFGE